MGYQEAASEGGSEFRGQHGQGLGLRSITYSWRSIVRNINEETDEAKLIELQLAVCPRFSNPGKQRTRGKQEQDIYKDIGRFSHLLHTGILGYFLTHLDR